jgi:hypothetical protein
VNRIAAALRHYLEHAQREYGITPTASRAIVVAPYLILGLFFFLMSYPPTQDFTALMTFPNYPIEWAMFAVFLSGGILSWRLAFRLRRAGEPRLVWLFYLIFAIGLLWTAGEVNAWGQKIFDYHTPAWMHARNAQHQMTLHNMDGWQNRNHWLRTAFAIGGFIGIALQRFPRYRKIAAPAILFSWFLVIAVKCGLDFWTKGFGIDSSWEWTMFQWIVNRTSKIVKLMIGIAALIYLWLNSRKSKVPAAVVEPNGRNLAT